jgi:hypothetical protein
MAVHHHLVIVPPISDTAASLKTPGPIEHAVTAADSPNEYVSAEEKQSLEFVTKQMSWSGTNPPATRNEKSHDSTM